MRRDRTRRKATSAYAGRAPRTGSKLAELRECAGLTQLELACRIECTRSYLATVERGHTATSWDFLRACIAALDCAAPEAIDLLETFASERGFVLTQGSGDAVTGAIVAAVERERRRRGARAVCPDCGASARGTCVSSCALHAEVQP